MRRVIANSTPLIVLSNIGRLDILQKLYGEIIIPQAVFDEVTVKSDNAAESIKRSADWLKTESVKDKGEYAMYRAKLHAGEVEVMILAQENPRADLVIIDDNTAKKTAKYLGLTVTGTMGVLLKAKQEGIIDRVSPLLNEIVNNGFFISEEIIGMVLKQAGELTNNPE